MSWSDERTLAFLRMYKNRPLLWDPTNTGYKNKNKRRDLLMELSGHFGLSKVEVEKKIRSLQSQFARERKKEKYSQMTNGSGRGEVYVSKWFGYQSMLFLVDKHKPKTTTTAETEVSGNQYSIKEEDIKVNLSETEHTETETEISNSPKKLRKEFAFPKKPCTFVKRKQRSYSATKMPVLNEAFNLMRSIQNKMEDKDEYTLFGEQVAVKLRKIPSPQARFAVQNIINKAFFDAEMGMFSYNSPSTSSGNTTMASFSFPHVSSVQSANQIIKAESISEMDEVLTL